LHLSLPIPFDSPEGPERDVVKGGLQYLNRKLPTHETNGKKFDNTYKSQTNREGESPSLSAGAPVIGARAGSTNRARLSDGSSSEAGFSSRARFPLGSEAEDVASEGSTGSRELGPSLCCAAPAPGGTSSPSSSEESPLGTAPEGPPVTVSPIKSELGRSNRENDGRSDESGETVSPASSHCFFARLWAVFLAFSLLYLALLRPSLCCDRPLPRSSGSGRRDLWIARRSASACRAHAIRNQRCGKGRKEIADDLPVV
jgi:hypothetical protein